ncbi:MAG: ABC-F family ATP-binding cassette domain-containing protein [Clostridiales bacterium]|jgi:ATP-binding cassette subfamily F protein 3|nr:ABC-F family ATP-binding cassette domain-containing protein [Clostridiales bacterium]
MLLNCKNLQKSFGIEAVLTDVTFILEEREKVAVVGVNGAGKTTLFRIINDEMPYDGGTLAKSKQLRIGYLPQTAELDSSNGIFQELVMVFEGLMAMESAMRRLEVEMSSLGGRELELALDEYARLTHEFELLRGYEYRSRVKGVIKGLGFAEDDCSQPIEQLSGGQKTRVALGKLLLQEPDLLLLDEPTNHLDIDAVSWLEEYLKGYSGAVLISSHDRYFLDNLVSKVIEIENKKAKVFNGNYSFYAKHKILDREVELKRYLDQQKEIKRQEEVISRLKSFNREKSIKQAESKEKRLEKLVKLDRPESLPDKMRIILTPKIESGNDVLDVSGLKKSFDGQPLFSNISFSIKKGDKVALIGPNGIGKTTLLRIIMNEIPSDGGYINRGVNVKPGYYDQEHESLSGGRSILDEMGIAFPHLGAGAIRNILAAFVFTGDDVFKSISALSGGEKGRVALAKLMLGGANFLVLDEPTNHLDMASKEILEEALRDYPGTILYISHDRYFINNTATKILEMGKDGLEQYLGDYDFYLEKKRQIKTDLEEGAPPGKQEWKKKKESAGSDRKRQNRIDKLERSIQDFEEAIAEIDRLLMTDEVARDHELLSRMFDEKTEKEACLMDLYAQWDELSKGE